MFGTLINEFLFLFLYWRLGQGFQVLFFIRMSKIFLYCPSLSLQLYINDLMFRKQHNLIISKKLLDLISLAAKYTSFIAQFNKSVLCNMLKILTHHCLIVIRVVEVNLELHRELGQNAVADRPVSSIGSDHLRWSCQNGIRTGNQNRGRNRRQKETS